MARPASRAPAPPANVARRPPSTRVAVSLLVNLLTFGVAGGEVTVTKRPFCGGRGREGVGVVSRSEASGPGGAGAGAGRSRVIIRSARAHSVASRSFHSSLKRPHPRLGSGGGASQSLPGARRSWRG